MATIRKQRGKWQVIIRKKDYPNISKVFIEKRTANKWAKQVETEMERGIFEDFTKAHSIIVRDLLVKYQKEITPKKKGYREETHKLNFLIRHPVSKLSLMRMKSSDIYSLINELKDKNRKPQTVKHYVQLLHVVWNTAKKVWGIPLPSQSPFALVSLDKVENLRDEILTEEECQRLLVEASKSELNLLPDLIKFLYLTGARYGEATSLLRANVNDYTMIATLIDTKNGKDRDIALNSEIVSLLKKYPFGDKFFNVDYKTFHKEFDKAKRRAGLPYFRAHDLRACFITNKLREGWSIAEVSVMSGHKSIAMVQRYTRIKAKDLVKKMEVNPTKS